MYCRNYLGGAAHLFWPLTIILLILDIDAVLTVTGQNNRFAPIPEWDHLLLSSVSKLNQSILNENFSRYSRFETSCVLLLEKIHIIDHSEGINFFYIYSIMLQLEYVTLSCLIILVRCPSRGIYKALLSFLILLEY